MARKAGTPNKPKQFTKAEVVEGDEFASQFNDEVFNEIAALTYDDHMKDQSAEVILEPVVSLEEESTETNTSVSPIVENTLESNTESENEFVEVFLSNTNANFLVSEILYIASLGGDLVPKHLPRFLGLPYSLKMSIPSDVYQDYQNGVNRPVWSSEEVYNSVVITSPDPIVFVRALIKAGKEGAVLPEKKQVRIGRPFQAKLAVRNPVKVDPSTKMGGKKVKYKVEELKEMKLVQLQVIGSWYGLSHRAKGALVNMILERQKDIE